VTALEAGTCRPPAGLLPTIANELGITVGELFGEAPSSSLDVIDRAVGRRMAALLDAARRSLPRE
jgi:hypothetical protein